MAAPSADELEQLLRVGHVSRAREAGWMGSTALHRMVTAAEGGQPLSLQFTKRGRELGFDLTNERGVAVVRSIQSTGVAAAAGLLPGDVVVAVDRGHKIFTCEAAVRALRALDPGEVPVRLDIVRPNVSLTREAATATATGALTTWQEEGLVLSAGGQHHFDFRTDEPAVLRYRFSVQCKDIEFKVGAAAKEKSEEKIFGRGLLLLVRSCGEQGSVPLHQPGAYSVVIDNSYSYVRSKTVSYSISLFNERQFEAVRRRERREELKREVERRTELSARLQQQIQEVGPKLERLRQQVVALESKLSSCKAEKHENDLLLTEAETKLRVSR